MRRLTAFWLLWICSVAPIMAGELSLTVAEPSGVDRSLWPVTSGVPLPEGALRNDQSAALFGSDQEQVALQTEVLARWPDGSIRWLLLDFQIDLQANQKKPLVLRYGSGVQRTEIESPLEAVQAADNSVTIQTGSVRLEYDPTRFQPQGMAFLKPGVDAAEDQLITINCGAAGIVLRDDADRAFRAHNPNAEPAAFFLEQAGPLRSCLRVEGWHTSSDERLLRYVARVHAYRGKPWIRVCYTFINDNPHSLMTRIKMLGIRFYARGRGSAHCYLDGQPLRRGRLFQVDESHFRIGEEEAGKRAEGWAAVGSDSMGMAVGLCDFWQNWPKAIECSPGRIGLDLCPELPEGLYGGKPLEEENKLYYAVRDGHHTFKVGMAKTHEFFVNYFLGAPDPGRLGKFFRAANRRLLAVADPAQVSASKALGEFPPADPDRFFGYDAWLDRALERHLQRREKQREYGMLNYGDWYGERRVNWGNLEYDLAHGMFLQYLRTGHRPFFDRGVQAARHHIDMDVIHATNPHLKNPWGPPPQVGEVWLHCLNHTGGYYENAPLPVSRTYQMGHSTNFGHVWASGDFEYYLLTGDRRARDVAIQMADAMVRHCPTRYGNHIRVLGWPMTLVLDAYHITGDRKYLDAATACWKELRKHIDWEKGWVVQLAKGHCVHPEPTCYGNVPFMEGLVVSALSRYHRVTEDPEVLRAVTVGIDQMIRECWVEKDKAFRYTACPLSTPRTYISVCLASEALAYESRLTGNREHRRILRAGIQEMIKRTGSGDGKSLAQLIHFTPYALDALSD